MPKLSRASDIEETSPSVSTGSSFSTSGNVGTGPVQCRHGDKKVRFYPKRPIKSFQDLEVYQKTYALAIEIVKKVHRDLKDKPELALIKETKVQVANNLLGVVLRLPRFILTAHSLRFGNSSQAIQTLEQAMLFCNLAVLYLEEYRDLVNKKIEHEYFEEQIKEYLRVRGKIMRLQRAWIKFQSVPMPKLSRA